MCYLSFVVSIITKSNLWNWTGFIMSATCLKTPNLTIPKDGSDFLDLNRPRYKLSRPHRSESPMFSGSDSVVDNICRVQVRRPGFFPVLEPRFIQVHVCSFCRMNLNAGPTTSEWTWKSEKMIPSATLRKKKLSPKNYTQYITSWPCSKYPDTFKSEPSISMLLRRLEFSETKLSRDTPFEKIVQF